MYKPDEDIDRLSRDAAEHYNAPGKPSWDALQQILDKELPQEKEKKRRGFFFFFWLLLGLSVAGTGLWYGITTNNRNRKTTLTDKAPVENGKEKKSVAEQPEDANNTLSGDKTVAAGISSAASDNVSRKTATPDANTKALKGAITKNKNTDGNATAITEQKIKGNTAESKTVAPVSAIKAKNTNSLTDSKNKPVVKTLSAGHSLLTHDKKIKNTPVAVAGEDVNAVTKQQSANTKLTYKKAFNQSLPESGAGNNSTAKKNKHTSKKGTIDNSIPKDATANEILTGIAANNNSDDKTKNSTDLSTKSNDQDQSQYVTVIPDTAANKPAGEKPVAKKPALPVIEKKDSTVAVTKKTKSKTDRAFNIGLVAGIDESTVKLTHSDNVGYNIGLTGGYQFSKHWSVYTGAIYTKKNYHLDGKDYHPPHPYWTLYVDLQNVEGYCKMWEIPLQARYTFNPGAKTPFFASAGLSSYFMTRQYYDYSYKNNMNQPLTGSWSTDSTFKHVFSILALSAGFEKSLGKHINLQVEPYAKIPFGGVGFGNIKLSSFGINFSVQYRHPVKR